MESEQELSSSLRERITTETLSIGQISRWSCTLFQQGILAKIWPCFSKGLRVLRIFKFSFSEHPLSLKPVPITAWPSTNCLERWKTATLTKRFSWTRTTTSNTNQSWCLSFCWGRRVGAHFAWGQVTHKTYPSSILNIWPIQKTWRPLRRGWNGPRNYPKQELLRNISSKNCRCRICAQMKAKLTNA